MLFYFGVVGGWRGRDRRFILVCKDVVGCRVRVFEVCLVFWKC